MSPTTYRASARAQTEPVGWPPAPPIVLPDAEQNAPTAPVRREGTTSLIAATLLLAFGAALLIAVALQ
jgi:hypothetical protein